MQKNLIAMAVAGACAWPLFATAGSNTTQLGARSAEVGALTGHWQVATPSSVDENAPWKVIEQQSQINLTMDAQVASYRPMEVITPHSVDENAPSMTAAEARRRSSGMTFARASLPNPQTAWSVDDNRPDRSYAEHMRAQAEHVASVEQARIAAASSHSEVFASGATSAESGLSAESSSGPPGERRDGERSADAGAGLIDTRQRMSGELAVESDSAASAAGSTSSFANRQEFDVAGDVAPQSEEGVEGRSTVAMR